MRHSLGKVNRNKENIKKSENGFGLLESIISAVILAILIATSVTVTNKYQSLNYRSSLRQAIAQSIDEDLTEIKLELETYLYQKKTATQGACYASSRNCKQSTAGVGYCNTLAQRAISSSSIIKSGDLDFNTKTHQILKGLKNSNSDLKRIVSVKKPDAPSQANQIVTLMDQSIVRVQYTIEGELANILFNNDAKKILTSIDLSPPAHSSCEY